MRSVFLVIVASLLTVPAAAQKSAAARDTLRRADRSVTVADPTDYEAVKRYLDRGSKGGFFSRAADFMRRPLFGRSPDANFRGRAMAGIAYSQETSVMFTLSSRAVYSTCRTDPLTPESTVAASVNVSVSGFHRLRVSGETFFDRGDRRLTYSVQTSRLPVKFWGLGYDAADNNPRTRYTRNDTSVDVRYMNRVAGAFSLGAGLNLRYGKGRSFDETGENYLRPAGGMRSALSAGAGLAAEFDTRDDRYRATRGVYLSLLAEARPKWMGDCNSTLWHITAVADWFHPLWNGAVLAADLYGDLWSSATPWLFWPTAGGASRMRGYYAGRYADRKMLTAQVEIRQRIYGRFGCCAWAGAGNVFPSHRSIDLTHTLPNYGIGLRMEAGPRNTVRVEYGFGRHSNGLIISMNEAF